MSSIIKKKLWEDRSNSGKLAAEHFLLLEVKLFIIIIEQKCVRRLYSESWMYDRCMRNTVSFLWRSRCFCEHCVHIKCNTVLDSPEMVPPFFPLCSHYQHGKQCFVDPGLHWCVSGNVQTAPTNVRLENGKKHKQKQKKISTYIHLIDLHFKYYFQKQAPDLINIH